MLISIAEYVQTTRKSTKNRSESLSPHNINRHLSNLSQLDDDKSFFEFSSESSIDDTSPHYYLSRSQLQALKNKARSSLSPFSGRLSPFSWVTPGSSGYPSPSSPAKTFSSDKCKIIDSPSTDVNINQKSETENSINRIDAIDKNMVTDIYSAELNKAKYEEERLEASSHDQSHNQSTESTDITSLINNKINSIVEGFMHNFEQV
jgi:hypothetical protein